MQSTPRPLAFDGYHEIADPVLQHRVLADFSKLGGDMTALLDVLASASFQVLQLMRERDDFFKQGNLREHQQWLRLEADRWMKINSVLLDVAPSPEAKVARVAADRSLQRTLSVLDNVTKQIEAMKPCVLLRGRRKAANGTAFERAHGQMPPLRKMSPLTEDKHLRAIRRNFLPTIIRTVYMGHIGPLRPTVKTIVSEELSATWCDDPGRKREVERRVSERLHRLTADLICCVFPFLGGHVAPAGVIDALKNVRRSRRRIR